MLSRITDPGIYRFDVLALQAEIVAFTAFSLGVFMLGRDLDRRLRAAFFLLTASIGFWLFAFSRMYASVDEEIALFWAKTASLGVAFIPAIAYTFSSILLRYFRKNRLTILGVWMLGAVFCLQIVFTDTVFASVYRYSWGYYPHYRIGSVPFLLYFMGTVSYVLWRFFRASRGKTGTSPLKNPRSAALAFAGGALAVVDFAPSFGLDVYPAGYILIFLFVVMSAYLMAMRRFPDVIPGAVASRVVETMQDGLIVLDRNGDVCLVNYAFCSLFGKTQAELLGRRLSEVFRENRAMVSSLESAWPAGTVDNREIICQGAGGTEKTLTFSSAIIRDWTETPLFHVCVTHDITERNSSARALEESNAGLARQLRFTQTLLKTGPVAVFFKDTEGRYLGCNEEFSKIVGVSPDEIRGKTAFDLWPAELAAKYHEQDKALLGNPGLQQYEFAVPDVTGKLVDVIFTKDVYTDEKGGVQGIIGTFIDISARKSAEAKIKSLNDDLEKRVQQRTAQLARVNAALQEEIDERMRTEESLRESERKYRALFEESFDGLFITSPGGAILDMNKKGIAMLGYSTKEEVQRLDLERDVYAHGADRSRILTMVREQGSAEYEVTVKKKDGSLMIAHCSLAPVRDGSGTISQYRGIIRDVTEKKLTEEALRDAKRRLEYVVTTSPAVIYTCRYGGDWQATFVSENLEAVLGYRARENIETPGFWIERVHPDDRERVRKGLQTLSDADHYAHEYRFLCKNGRYAWMLDRFRVVRDATGAPVECIGSWLDITERKQVEEDLKTSRIFLDNIVNSIQDPIVVLDRNRNILLANKTFEDVFITDLNADFLGKSCHDILFGKDGPCGLCLGEQSTRTGAVSHKVISITLTRGVSKWYDISAYPLFTTEGRVVGNVHQLRDITEQRKAEEKIVKDQEQLRSLTHQLLTSEERERKRIARELHDEMGQMLTGIKLSLQEIRRLSKADVASKVGIVQQDIGDLMVRMRDLSSRLRPSLLDDLGLLPALQWHIERFTKQTGMRVHFKHEGLERELSHEASLTLFRIVQESLTNAVRHSGADSVGIAVKADERTAGVTIKDEGAGFNLEEALGAGMTLGLAGMRERVEMAGGSLTIRSEPKKGTEIACLLPVNRQPAVGERRM